MARVSRDKQPLLMSGFCKQYYNKYITNDILRMIMDYFDTSIKWVVLPSQFPVSHGYSNTNLWGPEFTIDGITFLLRLEFCNYGNVEYAIFRIAIKSGVKSGEAARFTIHVRCDETQSEWRALLHVHFRLGARLGRGWRYYTLTREECVKFDRLNFFCDVALITKQNNVQLNKCNDTLQFKWDINDQLFERFKTCRPGQIIWCNKYFGIDNNFCLSCIPCDINSNNVILNIHILSLPNKIDKITFDWTVILKDDTNNFKIQLKEMDICLNETGLDDPMGQSLIKFNELIQLSSPVFIVTFKIKSYKYKKRA